MSECLSLTATQIAARIAAGDLSALEAAEAHIDRIEAVNPRLNAVVWRRYDAARAEARRIDHRRAAGERLPPLAGIPITVKESLDLEGAPSTFGLIARADTVATADEAHVARLRAAGAIVLGKTNVSQLLIFVETDNPVYGRTNNPWDLDRTCGGSSGGEGAIIAAGGSALGVGTDIGGSLRYPAAFCGVSSLKPTAGRYPDPGRCSVPVGQREIASQIGVLARSIDDVWLGLGALAGPTDEIGWPVPPLGDPDAVEVRRLRVGVYEEDGVMASSPSTRRAVREAADHLAGAGAQVVAWRPPDPGEALALAVGFFSADGGAHYRALLAGGTTHPSVRPLVSLSGLSRRTLDMMAGLLKLVGQPSLATATGAFGHSSVTAYYQLVEALDAYRRRFARAMDGAEGGALDLILGPASALPAFTHGATKDLMLGGANAILYNVLGYPAGVTPVTRVRADEPRPAPRSFDVVRQAARRCEHGSAGLPVGVQIAARPWREHLAVAALRVIEQGARSSPDYPARPPI